MSAPQGSPAWLAERCGKITASRFADVLATVKSGEAADRRNYRAQLVLERLTGTVEPTFISPAMQHGIDTEPIARAAFELATGLTVAETGFVQLGEWIGCSADGLIGDDEGIEIKCPQAATHLDTLQAGKMPSKHIPQVQGCMWVTGRKRWHFVSYHPSFPQHLRLFHQVIERDDAYITTLALQVQQFNQEVIAAVKQLMAMPVAGGTVDNQQVTVEV